MRMTIRAGAPRSSETPAKRPQKRRKDQRKYREREPGGRSRIPEPVAVFLGFIPYSSRRSSPTKR
jgi:hypothetical protein